MTHPGLYNTLLPPPPTRQHQIRLKESGKIHSSLNKYLRKTFYLDKYGDVQRGRYIVLVLKWLTVCWRTLTNKHTVQIQCNCYSDRPVTVLQKLAEGLFCLDCHDNQHKRILRNLFSRSFEAGKSKVKVLTKFSSCGEAFFLLEMHRQAKALLGPHTAERERWGLWCLFLKVTNPFYKAPAHNLI